MKEYEPNERFEDMESAERRAKELTAHTSDIYFACDRTKYTYPRYKVYPAPKIGEPVSYAFNGDYYPCGYIEKISPTMKKITTTDGTTFWRDSKINSCWRRHRTWSMVHGHIDERNPSF